MKWDKVLSGHVSFSKEMSIPLHSFHALAEDKCENPDVQRGECKFHLQILCGTHVSLGTSFYS